MCVFVGPAFERIKVTGVASVEAGKASEWIAINNLANWSFAKWSLAKWNFAKWNSPNEVSPNIMFCQKKKMFCKKFQQKPKIKVLSKM